GLGALDLAPRRRQALLCRAARPHRRTTGRWTWRWRCRWRRQDGRRSPAPTATRTTTSAPSASTSRRTTPTSHTPRSPCPICSEKITRDMLNHITMHHGYLFKNVSRLRRFVIPERRALPLLSRDLRDAHLQALLGGGHSHRSRNTTAATTNIYADPLLSSFGLGFATSDAEEPSKSSVPVLDDTSILKEAPPQPWESSIDSSLTSEEREQKRKQATSRATFVQDLVLSTLFGDD
uniref:Uncharacterized protein n=1 Tax=Aegilops tauschii subsp. strangulata TaxID=200361 RepID=A0A453F7K1_AEGTS